MKKITVIIPVYNAMTSGGGFITRAVDSVLRQNDFDIKDVEVLLINDGSKDDSLETLRKIERKNPETIRLIDQENMGVAKTRNKAIKLATGEYTTFLDQDDWLDDDFLSKLYGVVRESGVDVVISGYRRPNSEGAVGRVFYAPNTSYGRYMLSAAWAKLHKTTFLQSHGIEFFNNSYGEDIPFTVGENILTSSYRTIHYIGYNWLNNDESVSNTSQRNLAGKNMESITMLFKKLCDFPAATNDRDFNYFLLRSVIYSLLFSGRNATKSEFLEAKQKLFQILRERDDVFLRKNLHKLLIAPKGESLSVSLIVAVVVLLEKLRLMPLFALIWCKSPKRSS